MSANNCLIFANPNIQPIHIANNISFHKFLYHCKSSKIKNQSFIFHTIIPMIVQSIILLDINFQFTENLFHLYNSRKLKNHKAIYPVHNAKTHQYIQIRCIETNVIKDTIRAIHINFTLSFIFHIPAKTLKLNREKIENKENITQYDINVPEKANLVHNSTYPVSFHSGIKKLINNMIAIVR